MMRKRFLLILLCLLPMLALAEAELDLAPEEMAFTYTLNAGTDWVFLTWESETDEGNLTLYSPDGTYEGRVELPYLPQGGKVTVTVQNMAQTRLVRKTVTLPKVADYQSPKGTSHGTVKDLILTETPTGFTYSFTAANTDFMLLYYRTKQREVSFPIYPADKEGHYEGEVVCPLTYARTLFTVQLRSAKGSVRKEATVRKGYEAPEAPEGQSGPLSGVVICIDPGHQENGKLVAEPMGPGLSGRSSPKGGMAQGKVTYRKEDIVVLETAMHLRDVLLSQGATVVLTREVQDIFHTNIERCDIAEAAGAHIMLRLHCNNSSNTKKTGIQVYAPLNSDYARAVADPATYRAMGEAMLNAMKTAVGYELKDATGIVRLNDDYVGNNWAKMTCLLLEMGYMSNPGEDLKLATPVYQQMLAEGIAQGVYDIALMRGWITAE